MNWIKELLFGKPRAKNQVYYQNTAPNPKRGWLKKSDLVKGDLWYSTMNRNTGYVWTGEVWHCIGH